MTDSDSLANEIVLGLIEVQLRQSPEAIRLLSRSEILRVVTAFLRKINFANSNVIWFDGRVYYSIDSEPVVLEKYRMWTVIPKYPMTVRVLVEAHFAVLPPNRLLLSTIAIDACDILGYRSLERDSWQ